MKPSELTHRSGLDQPRASALFGRADLFILAAASISFLFSISLWFGIVGAQNKEGGLFVAVWVPSILSLGCFSKLARKEGHHG